MGEGQDIDPRGLDKRPPSKPQDYAHMKIYTVDYEGCHCVTLIMYISTLFEVRSVEITGYDSDCMPSMN